MVRTYSELITLPTFEERFEYLKLWDEPHIAPDKILYMKFLKSKMWLDTRDSIKDRDDCFDLAVPLKLIDRKIIVHHIDPITTEDLKSWNLDKLLNPENLITTGLDTHNNIHYKIEKSQPVVLERQPGDTTLW